METGRREKYEKKGYPSQAQKYLLDFFMIGRSIFMWFRRFVAYAWKYFWFKHLNDQNARFAGWVARFTGILILVGLFQVWAFVQSERAFLSISTIAFETGVPVADRPMLIDFVIQNSGRSTATIDDMSLNIGHKLDSVPRYQPTHIAVNPVPAGVSAPYIFGIPNESGKNTTLAPTMVEQIKSEKVRFYVYGYITYSDDFSRVWGGRTTGFCFLYDPINIHTITGFGSCAEKKYTYSH